MRRYAIVAIAIAAFVLASFLLVEALGIPLLTDPSRHLERSGPAAAALGIALLVADVLIPVPSSIIMTAQGALFGVVGGTLISLVGGIGAGMTGYGIGRKGSRLISRVVTPEEQATANRLLDRWGTLALIVSRPIPILAETMAITAGTSSLPWRRALTGIAIGALPSALIYAIAGAYATSVASGALVFLLVVFFTGIIWGIGWWMDRRWTPRFARTASSRDHRHE
jgi:uncharacterized membrane protein YdjX (TVP38/TMEM64 family)